MSGVLESYVTRLIVQEASDGRYTHLENALTGAINCGAIANEVDDFMMAITVETLCEEAVDDLADEVGDILDNAALHLGLMRSAGESDVTDNSTLDNGHWLGSVLVGDFTGEFSATKM